jgi:hypothetical protein
LAQVPLCSTCASFGEYSGPIDQHGTGSLVTELNFVLKILESGISKGKLLNAIKKGYENYDKNRSNGSKSKVTSGND